MKNWNNGLFWRVVTVFIIGICANNFIYGQCPTITNFDVPRGCANMPLDSIFLVSTADSIEIVAFQFGAGIDPYTSPGGTSLGVLEVPANDTLLVQPFPNSLGQGFYLFYAIAHPTPTDPTCRPSDVESVEIFEFVEIQTTDGTSCENSRINLADFVSGVSNANSVLFFDNLADANNETNPILEYDYPSVTTTYYVIAKASSSEFIPDNCVSMDEFTITVVPSPTANAGTDETICEGEDAQLSASGGSSYSWAPATLLDDATLANPTTNISTTTQFGVTVTDANGCTGTDLVTVTVTQLPVCLPISGRQN